MHLYSSSPDRRLLLAYWIAATAFAVAFVLDYLGHRLIGGIPWFIDMLGPSALYAGFYALFDRVGWRWLMPVSKRPIAAIADFSGRWVGDLRVSDAQNSATAFVEIRQSWTRFLLLSYTGVTRSVSIMASVDSDVQELRYELSVRSNQEVEQERALAVLRLSGPNDLEGSFFSNRRNGTLTLRRYMGSKEAFELESRSRRRAVLSNVAEPTRN